MVTGEKHREGEIDSLLHIPIYRAYTERATC